MKTDQSAFLNHVLDAIKKIEKYMQGVDEETFKKNDLVQLPGLHKIISGILIHQKNIYCVLDINKMVN